MPMARGDSASGCWSGFRVRRSGFHFSGEHFSQGPFNTPGPFLDEPDLFGLFLQEWGIQYWLQSIADMVIHVGNHSYSGQYKLVLVPLIGEYRCTGKNADQKIINQRRYAHDAQLIQHRSQGHSENENTKAKEKAE